MVLGNCNIRAEKRRLTNGNCFAACRRLGVRSARSWLRHSHASLTHIASPRVASQRFLGGLQHQLPRTLSAIRKM